MKKNDQGLESLIVDTALQMFNDRGIEYVGMREIASELNIRIGNLNYYFPTKDDLVNRLSLDLAAENNATIVSITEITMPVFFEMLEKVFHTHLKYRCLLLSFVHVVQRNPVIAKRYNKTQSHRNETWVKNVHALIESGYITAEGPEIDFLVSTIALIARFWISESVVSFRKASEQEQIDHYIRMIARIFLPYATTKGKKYLNTLLASTVPIKQ
jgi:AcrR family transcriptional regulator